MKLQRWLRRWQEEQGQAMVEMAIALPILLTLFCGIIDFGYIFGTQMVVTNASREGARYGSIHASAVDFQAIVKKRVQDAMPDPLKTDATILIELTDEIPRDGDVIVDISYTFDFLTPLTPVILAKQQYTVKAKTQMKCE